MLKTLYTLASLITLKHLFFKKNFEFRCIIIIIKIYTIIIKYKNVKLGVFIKFYKDFIGTFLNTKIYLYIGLKFLKKSIST